MWAGQRYYYQVPPLTTPKAGLEPELPLGSSYSQRFVHSKDKKKRALLQLFYFTDKFEHYCLHSVSHYFTGERNATVTLTVPGVCSVMIQMMFAAADGRGGYDYSSTRVLVGNMII